VPELFITKFENVISKIIVHINKDYAGINAYMKLKVKLRKDLKAKVELMKNNKMGEPLDIIKSS